MNVRLEAYRESAEYIQCRLPKIPKTAVVLGSGLGRLAKELTGLVTLPYESIPHFPKSTAPSHKGQLHYGRLGSTDCLLLEGRFHYYEGYSLEQAASYVPVLKLAGVENLILTNAAGGISHFLLPGDLMLLTDHIKFFDDSPLRGENCDELGPRFPDMTKAYTPGLLQTARKAASRLSISLQEGVYAYMSGPQYETPAEIRALRTLGADAVGMSTVPEVIKAAHCGLSVLALSCITNLAAGVGENPLTSDEVVETAGKSVGKLADLVREIVNLL